MIVSRLVKAMGDRGYNQKQLAQATGLTEAAICRYLKGNRNAGEVALVKLSRALNVSVDWLLGVEVSHDE